MGMHSRLCSALVCSQLYSDRNHVILFVLSFFLNSPVPRARARHIFSIKRKQLCSRWRIWLHPPSVADHAPYSIFSTEGPSLSLQKTKQRERETFRKRRTSE